MTNGISAHLIFWGIRFEDKYNYVQNALAGYERSAAQIISGHKCTCLERKRSRESKKRIRYSWQRSKKKNKIRYRQKYKRSKRSTVE